MSEVSRDNIENVVNRLKRILGDDIGVVNKRGIVYIDGHGWSFAIHGGVELPNTDVIEEKLLSTNDVDRLASLSTVYSCLYKAALAVQREFGGQVFLVKDKYLNNYVEVRGNGWTWFSWDD